MADPGFPIGGMNPLRGCGPPTWALFTENVCENERIGSHSAGVDPLGGMDLQCGHFSPKICVKMKEWGSVGGHVLGTSP